MFIYDKFIIPILEQLISTNLLNTTLNYFLIVASLFAPSLDS